VHLHLETSSADAQQGNLSETFERNGALSIM